jgi:tRNA1(Val) A37 N6-methylase TrmN6
MIEKIPAELWARKGLKVLDPCCGNGNFSVPIMFELLKHRDKRAVMEDVLEFNDINESRLENVRRVFCGDKYNLSVTSHDFIAFDNPTKYDLIVANPPYAKIQADGTRASKNSSTSAE